jgi:hypothetical protein
MSDTSHILGLPYIQPAQAQKHVTHNEALRVLDALVQLSVEDRDQTAPPATPNSGDRHIVAANASGVWTGQDGSIAVYEDAAWAFYAPQNGWQAVVRAEGTTLIFNGLEWVGSAIDASALQNVGSVGINTTADDVNRLAVSADATLLSHDGSDHRVVVNKDASTDTASLLFQTGYSGRAEMGTAGGDDFSIKVSPDSISWNTALTFDGTTGRAEFPSGAQVPCRVDVGGRFYCYTDNRWVTHNSAYGAQTENVFDNGGTGTEPAVSWENMSALVSQNSCLKTLEVALRSSSTETTGYDLRVYFQTGPWGAGWTSDGGVTRTLVGSVDNATAANGFNRVTVDLGNYEVPADGFVLVFMRPIGTLSDTSYFYTSMFLTYLSSS